MEDKTFDIYSTSWLGP